MVCTGLEKDHISYIFYNIFIYIYFIAIQTHLGLRSEGFKVTGVIPGLIPRDFSELRPAFPRLARLTGVDPAASLRVTALFCSDDRQSSSPSLMSLSCAPPRASARTSRPFLFTPGWERRETIKSGHKLHFGIFKRKKIKKSDLIDFMGNVCEDMHPF